MKKHWLISVATLALISTSAFAQDGVATAPAGTTSGKHYYHSHAPKTLEEARTQAHAKADKLDKMTQEEWDAKQGKRKAWKAKWDAMTPEQKAEYKKTHHRHKKSEDASSTSSAAPASPAAMTAPASAPEPTPAMPAAPATISPPTAASPAVTPPAAAPTAPAEVTAPPLAPSLPETPAAPAAK